MTRINVGIKPKELPDKLLLAEHREIKRIPNTISSGKAKVENIPQQFSLGTGHVKFFYNKLNYLKKRYSDLYQECILRGFNVKDYTSCFEHENLLTSSLFGDFKPTQLHREMLIERIESKGFILINEHRLCARH